jgi:hypothetical protein
MPSESFATCVARQCVPGSGPCYVHREG